MKKENSKIKVVRMLSLTGAEGEYKPWDEYSQEEKKEFAKRATAGASRVLSDYIKIENKYG